MILVGIPAAAPCAIAVLTPDLLLIQQSLCVRTRTQPFRMDVRQGGMAPSAALVASLTEGVPTVLAQTAATTRRGLGIVEDVLAEVTQNIVNVLRVHKPVDSEARHGGAGQAGSGWL